MTRSRGGTGGVARPRPRCAGAGAGTLLALAACFSLCAAGPLGPLPNVTVTSTDIGLAEGSCAMGDVVYMAGDEFPGAGPCERCRCAGAGGVQCTRQRCEPRPGCKALHRPDQCCPIYQCECEQDGRVYGNGEKLVDPADPCRVCYCQGGEVVCRRIACFVRDDCRPRRVPGRCCPEYDNCPLRGVTAIPGAAQIMISTTTEIPESPAPSPPKEPAKPAITIKEVTPVSEIPALTEVKIKEILPSPAIDVAEYSSSKSPLIVREATSEKAFVPETSIKTETPVVIDVMPSSSSIAISSIPSEIPSVLSESDAITNDSPPSKISLSTQDSINSEIYPSIASSISNIGISSFTPEIISTATTSKAPIIEEEDPTLLDHNPAFPPLPDDLSVVGNHEEEIVSEQNGDGEHISGAQEVATTSSGIQATEAVIIKQTTTLKDNQETTQKATINTSELPPEPTTLSDSVTGVEAVTTTSSIDQKPNSMLNLRSAIPTEILDLPSFVPEEINGELDEVTATSTGAETPVPVSTLAATKQAGKVADKSTDIPVIISSPKVLGTESEVLTTSRALEASTNAASDISSTSETPDISTNKQSETTIYLSSSSQEVMSSIAAKSHTATEITAQTEFSSLPIETSDQNPHEISENIAKEKATTSTEYPAVEMTSSKVSPAVEPEIITVSRAVSSTADSQTFENVETTEFILTSFGSSESSTDSVELIKISPDPSKSAAVIEPETKKNNVLTDLINLVGDVASIGEQTESPYTTRHVTSGLTSISDSEELIPVNAGYKSKNKNYNVNSITEVPMKTKNQASGTKQKVIEIEDDGSNITDSPPPYDNVEPTTRRAIIDNVSDDMPDNKTDKKDIEIITKSYVPTISRRPTKVVMKKNNERPLVSEQTSTENPAAPVSVEVATDGKAPAMSSPPPVATATAASDLPADTPPAATARSAAQ